MAKNDVLTIKNGVVTKCKQNAVDVVIPEGVTEIGKEAFWDCKSLSSVEFGGTMAQWEAVKGKLELLKHLPAKTVKCSDGEWQKPVVLVENGVAVKCLDKSATNVSIPEGVTEIGGMAFEGCKSLSSVVIPAGVTKIGNWAFMNCESLSSVEIPEGVTEIGRSAFNGCESLSSVVIPAGVTEIGDGAFCGCESLSSVVIPAGVTEIGEYAFNGCKLLKSIVIPSTVTYIGKKAFGGCEAVENVVSASASYPFNEKTRKLYDSTGKTKKVILVLTAAKEEAKKEKIEQVQNASASAVLDSILSEHKAETEVVRNKTDAYLRVKASDTGIEIFLPDSKVQKWMQTLPGLLDLAATGADAGALRKYAADYSLEDASKKYITVSKDGSVKLKKKAAPVYLVIGEGVTEIGWEAFDGCKSLSSVVIPATVTEIGWSAFRDCESLPSVEFGGTIAQWEAVKGKAELLYYVPAKTVKCSDGEWQKPSLLLVENGVLAKCLDESATSVTIPEGVTEIGEDAFDGCESLESVEFGGTMAQWEAVKSKQNLLGYVPAKTVKCSDGEWQKPSLLLVENGVAVKCLDNSATNVSIPEGVTEIGLWAFRDCESLSSVVIPASVTEIGGGAFEGCESLSSVVIGEGVTKIGESAFEDCKSLTSVVIPKGVTEIGGSAFYECESLKSVVIGEGVTEIGERAFEDCESLESVVIGEGVTEIGRYAFSSCKSLKSVVIPEGVMEIDESAFAYCESLSSVVIGEGVTKIGESAFKDCESLLSVVIPEGVTKIGWDAFADCESLSSVEFGGTMAQWEAVKGKEENLLRYIPAKTVKCSDGEWQKPVVLVEDGVLVACLDKIATSVTIPEGVTEIGDRAFEDCKSLSSVVIPEGVTGIGGCAFKGCKSLSSVVIPEGVTEIRWNAFEGCKSLSSVVIPEGVTEIGKYAFKGCESLSSVVIPEGVTKIGYDAFSVCKSLSSVEFGGTMAQWKAIEKGENWNYGVPAKTVKCTTGK